MPSTSEIASEHNIARSTAYYYLVAMDKAGLIVYEDGEIRDQAAALVQHESESAALLRSFVPCGKPELEEEDVECVVGLPTAVFGKGPFYLLYASGDSMVDEGIADGDMLVIRRQSDAAVGDIVVALDENNDNTLKKYAGTDRHTGEAILRYCSHEKYGDKEIRVKFFKCQGVLTHVIKQMH